MRGAEAAELTRPLGALYIYSYSYNVLCVSVYVHTTRRTRVRCTIDVPELTETVILDSVRRVPGSTIA
jgi:hypothetical protein